MRQLRQLSAVTTRYYGPTNHRGSRIKVTINNTSKFIEFDFSAHDPHSAAVRQAAIELGLDNFEELDYVTQSETGRGQVFRILGY